MKPAILDGAGNVFAVMTTAELADLTPAEVAHELCAARGLDGLLEAAEKSD